MDKDFISRLFSVTGKTALVTGGTSGIGRMIAEGLTAAGVRVYIVSRNEQDCISIAAEISKLGDCRPIVADLSDMAGVCAVADHLNGREEALHILVNNAGVFGVQALDDYEETLWDKSLDLNLKTPFFLSQRLLPLLRAAGRPCDPSRIINVGSGHGIRASNMESYAYASSKAGVHHLTRAMALRLGREHVTVNAIAPGVFPSRITEDFSDKTVEAIKKGVPLGRYGDEADVVGTLLYLTSRAGAYVSAVVLPVDGGWAAAN